MKLSLRQPVLAAALGSALVLAACGSDTSTEPSQPADEQEEAPTSDGHSEDEESTTGESEDDETPDEDAQAEESDGGDQGSAPVAEGDLPGDEHEMHFSGEGATVSVIEVEHDDVLFVRELPDPEAAEVGRFAPVDELTLAGRERSVESGLWTEVNVGEGVGWVNASYLAYIPDQGEDVSAEFESVQGSDAEDVVTQVADAHAEDKSSGEQHASWTLVEVAHDSPVYRVDVAPFFDDAQYGDRLEITVSDDGTAVERVTRLSLCTRGVTDDALCT